MPLLTEAIQPQDYELIAPAIVAILKDELPNQATLTGEPLLDAKVSLERSTPANQQEYPLITVRLANGETLNKDQSGDHVIDNTIIIDAYVQSKANEEKSYDQLNSLSIHRLLGVVREILLHESYCQLTLGKIVRHVQISSITNFNTGDTEQSFGVGSGQLIMTVRTDENSEKIKPEIIQSFCTNVKIGLTDDGYHWEGYSSGVGLDYQNDFVTN